MPKTVGKIINGKFVATETSTPAQQAALAEMLETHSPPRCMTDAVFLSGIGTLAQQFAGDDDVLERTVKLTKKYGYKPNANDTYIPSIAAYPGDPAAFVPSSDARGHIKKVCESRGWECHGAVNVKKSDKQERKSTRLGKDLVEQNVQRMVEKNPDLARVRKDDLRAEAITKFGAKN